MKMSDKQLQHLPQGYLCMLIKMKARMKKRSEKPLPARYHDQKDESLNQALLDVYCLDKRTDDHIISVLYPMEHSSEEVSEKISEDIRNTKLHKRDDKCSKRGSNCSKEDSKLRKEFLIESFSQCVINLEKENMLLGGLIRTRLGKDAQEKWNKKNSNKPRRNLSESEEERAKSSSKKAQIVALQIKVKHFKRENAKLKKLIKEDLGSAVLEKFNAMSSNRRSWHLSSGSAEDSLFVEELQTTGQNFCITDPHLPDNPIVYATKGFLELTGYTLEGVLGRNCRFLQGPKTDLKDVSKIRDAVCEGSDLSVCLLNYREDGTTFWNLFHLSALRDKKGNILNFVGIQFQVHEDYAYFIRSKINNESFQKEIVSNTGEISNLIEIDIAPNRKTASTA